MMTEEIMVYFLASMVGMGILIALFFRFHFGISDMESKITGIWSNGDDTMRVLMYHIDSKVQGEIVWTDHKNEKFLGTRVIRDTSLSAFGWSKGTYVNPKTNDEFRLKLKLRNKGKLILRLPDCEDEDCRQQWTLLK